MNWSKLLIFIPCFVISSLILPISVLACGGFETFPFSGEYSHSSDETSVFVWFRNGAETYVVEPHFMGNARDFGVLLPFPSLPSVEKAPEHLFDQLHELGEYGQLPIFGSMLGSIGYGSGMMKDMPQVVEYQRKDVGDYKVTIISADTTQVLTQWLTQNNYSYTEADVANFQYYLRNGKYYFAALKINLSKTQVDSSGSLTESLHPIGFTFKTTRPIVAHRISKGDIEPMDYNLYVLSDTMVVAPGTHIMYSNRIMSSDLNEVSTLIPYNAVGQWLTRMKVTMNPRMANEDLYLNRVPNAVRINSSRENYVLNSNNVALESGIVPYKGAENFSVLTTGEEAKDIGDPILLKVRLIFLFSITIFCYLIYICRKHEIQMEKMGKFTFFSPNYVFIATINLLVSFLVMVAAFFLLSALLTYVFSFLGPGDYLFPIFIILVSFFTPLLLEAKKMGKREAFYMGIWEIIVVAVVMIFFRSLPEIQIFAPFLWPF